MLIRNQKTTWIGLLLAVSFFGVLVLIFSPVFGQGRNGLKYSDNLFNMLAKGSAYFIPKVTAQLKGVEKEELAVSVKMKNAEEAAKALRIFTKAAPDCTSQGAVLNLRGNLAKVLEAALLDSNSMYYDKGDEVRQRYGMDEKEVMSTWWDALNHAVKVLQKSKNIVQSKIILEVMEKGIEPAYNFYKIEPQNVGEKAFTVTGLLGFYILYTLWWGFAIFYLFDGFGLSMKKARVKQEV